MTPLEVPKFIAQPSGSWSQDVLPLITLAACFPTLHLYWKTRRMVDFGIFIVGFVVAFLYHYCYMHGDGLEASEFWGVTGPSWRTLDIIVATFCLARTASHAVGASHPATLALPNVILPGVILVQIYTNPRLQLMALGFVTLLALFALKFVVEGSRSFPKYSKWRGFRVFMWAFLGFTCFVLPNKLSMYWFWHSMWHIFLGICYYDLYSDLERDQLSSFRQNRKLK